MADEKLIGRSVVYHPKHGPAEDGEVVSLGANGWVFVRYGSDRGSKATHARDLTLLDGSPLALLIGDSGVALTASPIATQEPVEEIIHDRADWLVDAVAGATQNRMFLRGDEAEDQVATEAIRLNGEKAIRIAIERALATERARREAAEAQVASLTETVGELTSVGGELANCAFNLAQDDRLDPQMQAVLRDCRTRWDSALSPTEPEAKET